MKLAVLPMSRLAAALFLLALPCASGLYAQSAKPVQVVSALGDYVVLGWNDLGMHCMNQNYDTMCVLPPYNVINAQVIRRGNPPQLVTGGVTLNYSFPANTKSSNKINFWTYATALFGVNLKPDIGLTGLGLTGQMSWDATLGVFSAPGVPLTPFEDAAPTVLQPYQLAQVKLNSAVDQTLLDTTNFVAPVSTELHCDKCHTRAGMSVEEAILRQHEGANLMSIRPVLCASCHSSNALGTKGQPGLPSLSEAVHGHHAEEVSPAPDCYDCHPGATTKCLRDIMFQKGKVCTDCHGSLAQVASSIRGGRRPWLDEPSCSQTGCHDANHGPEPGKLYRHSKGHGGLACEACHNSPHAVLPTVQPRDSVQVLRVQGTTTYIKDCRVCHTTTPMAPGPHGCLTAWRVANHLTGNAPLTGTDLDKADYNKDGKVDVSDVIYQVNRGM